MKPTVILFDVDGVLVQPGGYRAAVQAAVNYFTNQMGLGDLSPDADTIAIFEAQGITSEWDMVPLLLAMVLNAAVEQQADPQPWDSIQTAIDGLSSRPPGKLVIDFPNAIRALGQYVRVGEAPADSILTICSNGQGERPFARLAGQGVLRELLSYTRRPHQSLTTRVFTLFSLGDEVCARSMGLSPLFQAESLLAKLDRPLLAPAVRDRLNQLQQSSRLLISAYTARPSIPDNPAGEVLAVFAPEAEMALKQVGLEDAIIVGSGQMGQAAWELGENEDRLIKPAPYHAAAAIVAALMGSRGEAMVWTQAAFRFFELGEAKPQLPAAYDLPACLALHIFEDSPSGILGGKAAAEMLAQFGLEIDLHLWGVTSHPDKIAALYAAGAEVYADTNQAIEAAGVLDL